METAKKYYIGPPTHCDLCKRPITTGFVDGATTSGPWANMCLTCFKEHGRGVGSGKGQQYAKEADGRFAKVAG